MQFKEIIRTYLAKRGYNISKIYPEDYEKEFINIQKKCAPFTMTSVANQYGTYQAVKYLEKYDIEGDIVECGVYRGGMMMIAAQTLSKKNRELYLYDTYAGMSAPSEFDVNLHNGNAAEKWKSTNKGAVTDWDYASLEEVKNNFSKTDYPADKVHFIEGKVEDTIPATLPQKIALLRLDTDFYESTKHELEHLYPLLVEGGILIIDDYGHWKGSAKAVDEYFAGKPVFLHRLDYTARMYIKE